MGSFMGLYEFISHVLYVHNYSYNCFIVIFVCILGLLVISVSGVLVIFQWYWS